MASLLSDNGDAIVPFLSALARSGFTGEVASDLATRTVYATDNSVYEVRPLAILYPREEDDLNRIMRAATASRMPVVARGGGTGTNGQSLTDGIVVDCSRYLTRIIEIDPVARTAIVQPGVIRDQLMRAAAPHGLFFGPTCSTTSRATLGGMAATDASGKGSRVFGRTSDHILSMDVVLSDGSDWHVDTRSPADMDAQCERPDLTGHISRCVRDELVAQEAEIDRVFPVMQRGLTGYNLQEARGRDGVFHLTKLLAGSEGTLAITRRLTLRLLEKRAFRALMVASYTDALAAVRDTERLVTCDPAAIEFLDDRLLELAQGDPLWPGIGAILQVEGDRPVRGLSVVEVQADSERTLEEALDGLLHLATPPPELLSARIVRDERQIDMIWTLREKAVGLLGRMDPVRQGAPFVEDAAVPPARLADFIADFRALLDTRGLAYGMFGHADVGCVHVRPALDMRQPQDAAQVRAISDAVATLVHKHGGLLWGEHGKGYRGEYGPAVFGETLFGSICRIKAAFDPDNLLNPGKIATPDGSISLTALDAVPFRGTRDAQILAEHGAGLEAAVRCNGNGVCFNRSDSDAMCPSYKVSSDRTQSPKGRSALLREWARLKSDRARGDGRASDALAELEPRLMESLSSCLGCKACSSQCPVKVDIPSMRHVFYTDFYGRTRRPVRHHLLASLDQMAPILRKMPAVANAIQAIAAPMLRHIGLVDLPSLRPSRRATVARASCFDRPVALIEDLFLGLYDGTVVDATEAVLHRLGYRVDRIALLPNGKAAHVLGFKAVFERAAGKAKDRLSPYARSHVIIGIEPAATAMWESEYKGKGLPDIVPISAFLADEIKAGRLSGNSLPSDTAPLHLFGHCTERAVHPRAAMEWEAVFGHFGRPVIVEETGCCGMAGTYGHEAEHQLDSRRLFDMSWREKLGRAGQSAMATGFSCRCQVKRFGDFRPDHPMEKLARLIPA